MNAIVLLSSRRPPKPPRDGARASRIPANDVAEVSPAGSPEAPLVVSFVGLTPEEQRRALASFPGGARCSLAEFD
jgi:hypothetical protein